jgi:hypothetical protein
MQHPSICSGAGLSTDTTTFGANTELTHEKVPTNNCSGRCIATPVFSAEKFYVGFNGMKCEIFFDKFPPGWNPTW